MYQLQFVCPYCDATYLLRSRYEDHFRTHPFKPSVPGEFAGASEIEVAHYMRHAERLWPAQNGFGHFGEPPVTPPPGADLYRLFPGPGGDVWGLALQRSRR